MGWIGCPMDGRILGKFTRRMNESKTADFYACRSEPTRNYLGEWIVIKDGEKLTKKRPSHLNSHKNESLDAYRLIIRGYRSVPALEVEQAIEYRFLGECYYGKKRQGCKNAECGDWKIVSRNFCNDCGGISGKFKFWKANWRISIYNSVFQNDQLKYNEEGQGEFKKRIASMRSWLKDKLPKLRWKFLKSGQVSNLEDIIWFATISVEN